MHILELFEYKPSCGNKLETQICGILMRNAITTTDELRQCSDRDLLKMRGMGKASIQIIRSKLEKLDEMEAQ